MSTGEATTTSRSWDPWDHLLRSSSVQQRKVREIATEIAARAALRR